MEDVVTDKEHIENDIEKAEALNNEAEGNKEVPKRNMRDCIYGNKVRITFCGSGFFWEQV